MSVGTTAAIVAGVTAAGAIGSAAINAHAAGSAADKQKAYGEQAIDFQNQVYGDQKTAQQPYQDYGKLSISKLMEGFQNGTFGPGSIPNFAAPTAEQARATPGYQFTQQEGNRGVMAAASAGGRSLSGGALKAIDRYNTGLADSTYGDTFSRALQTYQAQLAGQSQNYNELMGGANLGENATQSINNTGTQAAQNIGNIMTGIGNTQAASTLARGQAWSNGLNGVANGISGGLLWNQGGGGNFINSAGGLNGGQLPLPPPLPDIVFGGAG